MMTKYTRAQILENRTKFINFLKGKHRKKAESKLDDGQGARCCLGHGCYVLGILREKDEARDNDSDSLYLYEGEGAYAPKAFVDMVGLWHNDGSTKDCKEMVKAPAYPEDREEPADWIDFSSLASLNDESIWTTQQIGKFLETVIEGGENTPFKPLSKYPA